VATIALTAEARGGKTESDAYVFVEYCDTLRRSSHRAGMQGFPAASAAREVPAPTSWRQPRRSSSTCRRPRRRPRAQGKAPVGWLTDEVDRPPSTGATLRQRGLFGFGAAESARSRTPPRGVRQLGVHRGTNPMVFSAGATFCSSLPRFEASWLKPADSDSPHQRRLQLRHHLSDGRVHGVAKLGVPLST